MKLMTASGVMQAPAEEDLQKVYPTLVGVGMHFLRAGGSVSMTEWSDLLTVEKLALAEAGDKLWAQRAAQIGAASLSPQGVAEVAAAGGDTSVKERIALEQAATQAAEKVMGTAR